MKNTLLLFTFLMTATFSNAQDDFQVLEQNVPYHKLATSFTIDVIGAGETLASHQWEKFVERHKGTTYLIEHGEGDLDFVSEHVEFPFLNNQLVTIHSRFAPNSSESGVLMTIWIQMKDGSYYSTKTNPEAGKNIKKWLLQFHDELMQLNRTH